jgi:endo-1,4-beta-xylanase
MDIAIPEVAGADFSQQLQEQAKIYGDSIAMCVAAKNCTAIIFWGFTDRYTWMTSLIGQGGHPLLFDKFFRPKPAYTAVKKALEQ